jgi:WD40 repeat protein
MLSADGKVAISTGEDGTKLWDVLNAQKRRALDDTVAFLAMSAEGRIAISASSDGALRVWDMEFGRECRTFQGDKLGSGT